MYRFVVIALLLGLLPLRAQEFNPAGQRFPQVALNQPARGAAIITALGNRLPEVARWYGATEAEFRTLLQRDRSIMADSSGRLAYACAGIIPVDGETASVDAEAVTPMKTYPLSETFALHSRPGANRKIYLDFNGHTTSGTPWNGGATFTTPAYDTDGNPSTFSNAELTRIQGVWKRVAEDFAPFAVDVTTEDPGVEALRRANSGDQAYGIRVCIGGSSYDWYKRGAGGVAYIGSFNWNTDTPCYVFTAQLGNGDEKNTAEATSHEVGHTLGLNHDGQTNGTEYYTGHGNWAPIMGVGYGKEVVQWSKGEYDLANNTQDDTAVMQTYGAPLVPDDAGDNIFNPGSLAGPLVAVDGIISTRGDRDFYQFSTGAGNIYFDIASPSPSPNLDAALTLYDVTGKIVATGSPANSLTASINTTVAAGTYYITVDGVAPGNPVTNYNDYGSLGAYELTGSFISNATNTVTVIAADPEAAETLSVPGGPIQPANTGRFVFTRLVVTDQPLVVPFTVSGTATPNTDYTMPTTVTIPARTASTSITVTPVDDFLGEGSESVVITLQPSASYEIGVAKEATVQIRDNELAEVSILAPAIPQIMENSATPMKLTVVRNIKSPMPLTVPLVITGTAEAGTDYVALPSSVTFPANEDKRELLIEPFDNSVFNLERTVIVTISPDPDYLVGFQKSATVRILNEEPLPDTSKPSVSITAPKAKQRFPVPITTLTASGTASDNLSVAAVHYRLNGGAWKDATLNGGTWSADLTADAVAGNNLLEAQSKDADGNLSSLASTSFAVVQNRTLTVNVSGPGSVSPGTGTFEASQVYTLTAKPQAGKIFAGWTGDLTGTNRSLPFTMPDADVTVTATFLDNPFAPGVIGKYAGLARGATTAPETTGLLEVAVSTKGIVTGKLRLGPKIYRVRGEFNGSGRLDAEIVVPKEPKITLGLDLDLNPNGTQAISGTITRGFEVSNVTAKRAPYDAKKNPLSAEFARSYTFFLPKPAPVDGSETSLPDGDDTAPKPEGTGVGVLTITNGGVVRWTGTLGDGTPVTQATTLDGEKGWPLFLSLYKAGGYVAGNVTHDPAATDSDLQGTLNWIKVPNPSDVYFPGGFRLLSHRLIGVNYAQPAKGQRVLTDYDTAPGNSGPIELRDGNLSPAGFSGSMSLLPTNAAQIVSPAEKLKLSLNAKTGAVKGSFVFPVTRKATQIRGVVLQGKLGFGIGIFPGSTINKNSLQTGTIEFGPEGR